MKKYNLQDMIGGWFIGNFEPSVVKIPDFEVAVKYYLAGQSEPKHTHKEAVEFTVIVKGTVVMNGKTYMLGDIIEVEKMEAVGFVALTDVTTVVVKIPSVLGDKYVE